MNRIAILAGNAIMEIYHGNYEVEYKEDLSPLTKADIKSHQIIYSELRLLSPLTPVISEEGDENIKDNYDQYWLVDPLDGTKEFVNHNGEFTVNIALIELNNPILGVVYAPAKGMIYYAANRLGAFKKFSHQDIGHRIHVRQQTNKFKVVGSRSHSNALIDQFISKIDTEQLISIGSSLKFCMVAEGSADIYPRFGLTSYWDTAAAQCIVEEAGGKVFDIEGLKLTYPADKISKLNPFFLASGVSDEIDLISALSSIKQQTEVN